MDDARWERIERTMAMMLAKREHQAKCEAMLLKMKANLERMDETLLPLELHRAQKSAQFREEGRLNRINGYVDRGRIW